MKAKLKLLYIANKLKELGKAIGGVLAILILSGALGFIVALLCKTFVFGWGIVY